MSPAVEAIFTTSLGAIVGFLGGIMWHVARIANALEKRNGSGT
jgi:hypothetical protein